MYDDILNRHFFFYNITSQRSVVIPWKPGMDSWPIGENCVFFCINSRYLKQQTCNPHPDAEGRNVTGVGFWEQQALSFPKDHLWRQRLLWLCFFWAMIQRFFFFFWKGNIIKSSNRRPWHQFCPLSLQELQTPCRS